MCGIVAYVGYRDAYPILINGLRRLEYRGYDSAGVALLTKDAINLYKTQGKVADLEHYVQGKDTGGTTGIAHTRWATHGEPNTINAHPHFSESQNLALIHNGIIENYHTLKAELEQRGHIFRSQTDTEVLVYLIEDIFKDEGLTLFESVQIALSQVVGAYAIVVLSSDNPDELIAARKSSPLVVGLGKGEMFVASDATPLIEFTSEVVYLNDEEVALIRKDGNLQIRSIDNRIKSPYVQKLQLSLTALEKGGYEHFMLKEIFEQPRSILDSMRGRLRAREGIVVLGGILDYEQKLMNAGRIIIVGCGTSWHAALVGEYLIEELSRIPVEVEYASEFRYRNPVLSERDVVIAISQSGETADTLAAIEMAKLKGATIIGICNVVGSSIARATHAGSYTHAGPEIGVASTKAFTAQVTLLTLLALRLAQLKGTLPASRFHHLLHEMDTLPAKVEKALQVNDAVRELAKVYTYTRNFLYLGRGYNYPVAMEGALKLKEISYIHAEGYPAAEMKHGPIALIDHEMPVVVIATKRGTYEKVLSNMQEIKARNGRIIAIVTEGDVDVRAIADYTIEIPDTDEIFGPILATIPLQLLAYHIAVMRGTNVDQPRNLAKSVTVE
ncbi:MAG: glutamine--fructose-6-phosphate transaminase (isomerizing) [Bacteroidales bacterium]|nr:glutamine--fructose-6-phosphate transaminase (isomerizing) [Bacteroidales bacterium]MDD3009716.1 glutamine--fructose-6-phosphate transaminase (isomerizing) [Bacteroidales bacterium]MDD3960689.1 glutamine--fructose-6-phosphate transaminase (isomerizing) [Bacteroidales bacterium]MDY0285011.1 glutamine--fructose-6-phosphate transaminase (isomerizing) [Bacteroidales bacterium]HPE86003.1 glutamine--fructose-6-phosphate transaminase (isomerizing) [Bacteroidales bacterium]